MIEAVAFMGNIEITVPPQITVECDGDSLLGTFTLKYSGVEPDPGESRPGDPRHRNGVRGRSVRECEGTEPENAGATGHAPSGWTANRRPVQLVVASRDN